MLKACFHITAQGHQINLLCQLWRARHGLRLRQSPCRHPHAARQQPPAAPQLRRQIIAPQSKASPQKPLHLRCAYVYLVAHLQNLNAHHAPIKPADTCCRAAAGVSWGMLATTLHPAAQLITAPPLVIAHGLFGSARNWGVIAKRMADVRDVIAVDMRNHGNSPHTPSHSYPDMADDLAKVIAQLGGPVDLLGHSMGGKAAMQLALTQPADLRRLIVADIAPVAYNHDQSRNVQAMQALDLHPITSRAQADSQLAAHINDPALRAFFLQSLDLKTTPPTWKLNLPVLAQHMPLIIGWPDTRGTFDGPALFLTGENSPYVGPQHRPHIQTLFPNARFAQLANAGHWLHAEAPRAFEDALRAFLTAP